MIRRQLELEHSRREQELARRMQEATTRETRSVFLTELKSKEILMQMFILSHLSCKCRIGVCGIVLIDHCVMVNTVYFVVHNFFWILLSTN